MQYIHVMERYLHGDTGPSASTESFDALVGSRLPEDLLLLATAMAIAGPLAVGLGVLAALWRHSGAKRVIRYLAIVASAVPAFWLAVMIGWLDPGFFGQLRLSIDAAHPQGNPFPLFWSKAWFHALAQHPGTILGQLLPLLLQALIPVVAASTITASLIVHDIYSRSLRSNYARVERAAGLPRRAIEWHAFRANLPEIIVVLAGHLPVILGAMALAEFVLGWPGSLGLLFYAGMNGDPAIAQGLFIITALLVLAVTFLASVLQGILDPRVRESSIACNGATAPSSDPDSANHLWLATSAVGLALLVGMAVFAPLLSPESFTTYDYSAVLRPPHFALPWEHGWRYIFGSDGTGHSMLMWVTYGARIPLMAACIATLIATAITAAFTALSFLPGRLGVWADLLVSWISTVLTIPPAILLVFLLSAYLSHGQWPLVAVLLGLAGWPRIVRALQAPELRSERDRVILVSRAQGLAGLPLLRRSISPLVGPAIQAAFHFAAAAVGLDAAIDFLGAGVSPTAAPTWGNAFAPNPNYVNLPGGWVVALFPGLCILLCILSLNGAGDGLRALLLSPGADNPPIRARMMRRAPSQAGESATLP